jgi:glycerol-3-phosphate dehydrogenase (NAD(P)+)
MKVAVLGAGSWGTALASVLAQNGHETVLWARRTFIANEIMELHTNQAYLPDAILPNTLIATTDVEKSLHEAELLLLAVTSQSAASVLAEVKPYVGKNTILAHAIKGFDLPSKRRISEVFLETFEDAASRICVIAGPSHAEEVINRMPTTIVCSGASRSVAQTVQDALMNQFLRVYTNPDVVGAELGGTLKNIIALGVGIADGLKFGDNAKAALMTRGLAEIMRLGIQMGASAMTFAGLSGVGDLIVTCTSKHSRNFRAGRLIGQGVESSEAQKQVGMVVEGVRTAKAAYQLANDLRIEMPITEAIYGVLFNGEAPNAAVNRLMGRERNHEIEDVVYQETTPNWQMD